MGGPVDGNKLIQSLKIDLIKALGNEPDFVLQHCHSLTILSNKEYNNIKDTCKRSEKIRDILDYVINKDDKCALKFLRLLKTHDMQETFPDLQGIVSDLSINKRKIQESTETTTNRKQDLMENNGYQKKPRMTNSRLVTEKEMMRVARCIGTSWKEVGITALDMTTIILQQIEEDNRSHRERVFAMLRRWSMRERDEATPAHLYDLLTQEENGVDPLKIDFLIGSS